MKVKRWWNINFRDQTSTCAAIAARTPSAWRRERHRPRNACTSARRAGTPWTRRRLPGRAGFDGSAAGSGVVSTEPVVRRRTGRRPKRETRCPRARRPSGRARWAGAGERTATWAERRNRRKPALRPRGRSGPSRPSGRSARSGSYGVTRKTAGCGPGRPLRTTAARTRPRASSKRTRWSEPVADHHRLRGHPRWWTLYRCKCRSPGVSLCPRLHPHRFCWNTKFTQNSSIAAI